MRTGVVLTALGVALGLLACTDIPEVDGVRYACAASSECGAGYTCVGGECVPRGALGDASDGLDGLDGFDASEVDDSGDGQDGDGALEDVQGDGIEPGDGHDDDAQGGDGADTTTASDGEVVPDDTGAEVSDDVLADTQGDATGDDGADSGAEVEVEPELNACGGLGTLTPGEPGDGCGPCGDGTLACDPDDPALNTTRCEGASELNECLGCGELGAERGELCGTCGTYDCDPEGSLTLVCIEPPGGCQTALQCADLGCDAQGRTCVESDGEVDAYCDVCLPTHGLVGEACAPLPDTPTDVSATTDRASDVEVSWSEAANATGYSVQRCALADCAPDDAWTTLTANAIATTSYRDASVTVPAAPGAPTLSASTDLTDQVALSWTAVVAPTAPRYRYRVIAVADSGTSDPSADAEGATAERPVTAYELKIGSANWVLVPGGLVTAHSDTAAPAPTLSAGSASASQGTYAEFVRLVSTGASATAGAARTYLVRAKTATGTGAQSEPASGWRVAGAGLPVGALGGHQRRLVRGDRRRHRPELR